MITSARNTRGFHITVLSVLMGACAALTFPHPLISQKPTPACPVATSYGPPPPRDTTYHARYADPRVNYSTTADEQFLCRWNLQRRDPKAALSDVVQPILYLVDGPKELVPLIIDGVNAWEPVFEAIGFRHVFTARAITPADSDIHDHVVRISVVPDWGPGPVTNCWAQSAWGDLSYCEVKIPQGLARDEMLWCRIWAGPDPAVPLPCTDSVQAPFITGVVAHEIGHTLGLDHNYNAGHAYPTDSLRSPTFVHTWGWTPSIMLHRGYDEASQPDDHIPMVDRWLKIGPQDRWAIAWGYRPIPGASTPEAEEKTLEEWRSAQDTALYLRIAVADVYGSEGDEGAHSWGGNDVVKAMTLWFPNAARLLNRLFPSGPIPSSNAPVTLTSAQRQGLDSAVAAQWRWRMIDMDNLIGGRVAQTPYPQTPEDTLRTLPLPSSQQLAALRLVLSSALYGQDTVMQWKRTAMGEPRTSAAPSSDSTPIVFDSAAIRRARPFAVWQSAQHNVLEQLMQNLPALPSDVQPDACRDLAAATRHLASLVSSATGPRKSEAEALQHIFTGIPEPLKKCH